MEKKFASKVPVQVERNGSIRVLNYGVREASEAEVLEAWKSASMSDEGGDVPTDDFVRSHKYVYHSVRVPMAQWKYDGVINAIIRDKYRSDEMEAINNNMAAINAVFMQTMVTGGIVEAIKFLKESADAMDAETFREMQEWRAMAKKEAKKIFDV
jgi:hypothetical protein